MATLKETLLAKIQEHRPRTQKLVKEHADVKIGEVTIAQAIGGARGVRMLVTDISYLDPFEGIRFRGKTIPETFAALPKVPGSDYPYVEAFWWFLLTGEVPTEQQTLEVVKEFQSRRAVPAYVGDMLRAMARDTHPMTMFSAAILSMQRESLFVKRYNEGMAQANPGMSPNPAKAPWYFMGLQELLVHLHPAFAVFVVPLLAAALLLALPYLRYGEAPNGAYFHSRTGARTALAAAVAALVLTPVCVLADETIRRTPPWLPSLPPAVRNGFVPAVLVCAVLAVVYLAARRLFSASRLEAVQALLTFLIVAFVVLTVTGSLFRGQAMALAWPWAVAAVR